MSRALVLNATYEPIGVVSSRRAVVLALSKKVDVLVETDERVASERLDMAVPSVVRLRYFVKVPFQRQAPLTRRAVFARDRGICQYCAKPADSIDHILPRSRGGGHEWTNVVACCRRCNGSKGDKLLSECTLRLRSRPVAPSGYVWVAVAVPQVPPSWDQYLGAVAA